MAGSASGTRWMAESEATMVSPEEKTMERTTPGLQALALATVVLALAPTAAAQAQWTLSQIASASPTENCQAALPVFDGNIRKRPLAMQNEGSTSAFVTCAFRGATLFWRQGVITGITVNLRNDASTSRTIGCTLVTQNPLNNAPSYSTLSRQLAPGASATMQWDADGNGSTLFYTPAVSCSLPPGAAISRTATWFSTSP